MTEIAPTPHGGSLAPRERRKLISRGLADLQRLLGGPQALQPAQPSNPKVRPDPDDWDALFEIRRAAERHADALFNLGFVYRYGEGVTRDDAETARWYRRAAEQGHAGAQFCIGFMYRHGKGVPQDDTEAARWYRRAAEQGDARAQVNLGDMYDAGRGVAQDDRQAFRWYRRASEQGIVLGPVREDPMRLNDFWGIVERSRRSTDEETAKALVSELKKYTTEDVERFADRSGDLHCRMPRAPFADLCRAATGYCSDDHLVYFCSGIIAAGRTAYEEITVNPTVETLRKHFKDVTRITGESFSYAASGLWMQSRR